jgi:hypothetical protein
MLGWIPPAHINDDTTQSTPCTNPRKAGDVCDEQRIAFTAHVPVAGVDRADAHTRTRDLLVRNACGKLGVKCAQFVEDIIAAVRLQESRVAFMCPCWRLPVAQTATVLSHSVVVQHRRALAGDSRAHVPRHVVCIVAVRSSTSTLRQSHVVVFDTERV